MNAAGSRVFTCNLLDGCITDAGIAQQFEIFFGPREARLGIFNVFFLAASYLEILFGIC